MNATLTSVLADHSPRYPTPGGRLMSRCWPREPVPDLKELGRRIRIECWGEGEGISLRFRPVLAAAGGVIGAVHPSVVRRSTAPTRPD
jgi:hypothetical protein